MNNKFLEDDTKRGGMFSLMVKKISTIEEWIRKHNSYNHGYKSMPSPEILGGDTVYERFCMLQAYSTTNANGVLLFSSRKLTIPTVICSAANTFGILSATFVVIPVTAISISDISRSRCSVDVTVAGGLVAGNASVLFANNTLTASITITG